MNKRNLALGFFAIVAVAVFVSAATLQQERQVSNCFDTDGLNFTVLGHTNGNELNSSPFNYTDYCFNSNVVVEFACDNRVVNGSNQVFVQGWSQNCNNLGLSCVSGKCQ